MYKLLIKQFFRSRAMQIAFGLLLVLGLISIAIGKQFLDQQHENIAKTYKYQKEQIKSQMLLHPDDLGYLMYYIKFNYINKVDNLAGIAIGQRDLNTNIQNIGILNIENQKYDTDLINPMRLQVGNLDLSFVIIFLFPLVIIALSFNLLSEEVEIGTWKMIRIQGKSPFVFLLSKLSVRFLCVIIALLLLFITAKLVMSIPFDIKFLSIIAFSTLYVMFWFSLSLFIISFQKRSNFNAISLLTLWLLIVIILPITTNKYVTTKYPIGEALSLTIKQRDAYHKKWDTDKKETMQKFYKLYPELKSYGYFEKGFNWEWYYAMQQMGDEESKTELKAMFSKIKKRLKTTEVIANFLPSIKTQLVMNDISETGIKNYLGYLNATTIFHQNIRSDFYKEIFSKELPNSVDWDKYQPKYYLSESRFDFLDEVFPILFITLLVFLFGVFQLKKGFCVESSG